MKKKDDAEGLPQIYIKTPFQFTKFHKNLTLLQQNVMVKVMEHLQHYLVEYFESDLKDSPERPKPLFSQEAKAIGIEPITIKFSDLGVAPNNYPGCREAIGEVMSIKIQEKTVNKENGKPVIKYYNIFPEGEQEIGSTYAKFVLNSAWLDRIFDMRYGYISHPADIATLGKVENMPMIYYYLRHETRNWSTLTARVQLSDIKSYLGMYEMQDGAVVSEKYKKYSQFKQYVLDASKKELEKLSKKGKVDITFDYESKYRNGRKTGNPDLIIFTIKRAKKVEPAEVEEIEDVEKPKEEKKTTKGSWKDKFKNPTTKLGQVAWDELCTMIQNADKRRVFSSVKVESIEKKTLVLYGSKDDIEAFDHCIKEELDKTSLTWVLKNITTSTSMEIKKFSYHIIDL